MKTAQVCSSCKVFRERKSWLYFELLVSDRDLYRSGIGIQMLNIISCNSLGSELFKSAPKASSPEHMLGYTMTASSIKNSE